MTPMLVRIEQDLAKCTDPHMYAELMAERGCYFARIGNFMGANEIVGWLRQGYSHGNYTRVSIWIMLLEGFISFFDEINIKARDRFRRAIAVGEAYRESDLVVLAASWLAHIEFNRSDFESMALILEKCTAAPISASSPAGIRLGLTIADAYLHSGSIELARSRYENTRRAAVSAGDGASISALIYNKAALELVQLRVRSIKSPPSPEDIRFVAMEIQSAINYQAASGHAALSQLFDVCRAGILMLEGEYSNAAEIIQPMLALSDGAFGYASSIGSLRLDFALCMLRIGSSEVAHKMFLESNLAVIEELSTDDQIVYLATYIELGKGLDDSFDLKSCERMLDDAFSLWADKSRRLRSILDKATSEISFV